MMLLVLVVSIGAAEPLSPAEREQLQKQAQELTEQAASLSRTGKSKEALLPARRALALREQLYPAADFPDGHPDLAKSHLNLAVFLRTLGEHGEALKHCEKAFAMNERLYPAARFPDGHPLLAASLTTLAATLHVMGETGKALPYAEKAVAMFERHYPLDQFHAGHIHLVSSLNTLGIILRAQGEMRQAVLRFEQALALRERQYPRDRFPNGHPELSSCLTNLGEMFQIMGEYGKALPCYEKALAMLQLLYPPERFKDGHPSVALALNRMGELLRQMGELGKALPYVEKALAINERLYPPERFKDGHPNLAGSLNNLGLILVSMGEHDKALPYYEKSLAMVERLYPPDRFPNGHPHIAAALNNLGGLLDSMGKEEKALPYFEKALAVCERLYPAERFPNGHPDLAATLNNLGGLLLSLGQFDQALPFCVRSVDINERLYPAKQFPDGHPALFRSIANLSFVLISMGKHRQALPSIERGLEFHSRRVKREMIAAPESQAVAYLPVYLRHRDAYLSAVLSLGDEPPANVYARIWPARALLLDLASRRHQSALVAASASGETRRMWEDLVDVRRRLSRLAIEAGSLTLGVPRELVSLTEQQERLERELAKQIPELERYRRLELLGPAQLHDKLERGTAFIDIQRHVHGEKGHFVGRHYQAFVLVPGRPVRRIDLGPAKPVEEAVESWRRSIDRLEESAAPRKLRELVWDRLSVELAPETRLVYLCLEGDLARLPWGALPGTRPGTILLEELAVAVVPSGKWLLEQLLYPQNKDVFGEKASGHTLVAVGAIDYGPARHGAKAGYPPLPESSRELQRVLEAFGAGAEQSLRQDRATPAELRERLAKAHYAHLATHGYFDEAGLHAEYQRVQQQLGQWAYRANRMSERVGVAQHPLAFVGLALSGANDPATAPEGGLVTGLGIVDLPLKELRLCVLSACKTGLGQLTEGEGVVGLQRAFHVAGCPNVIGTLWKVNDAATAALMTQLYHELRIHKRSPLEALREAQLTIYRYPDRIAVLAGERGRPALAAAAKLGSATIEKSQQMPTTTPTRLWAAFVLSGVGK
jgi:CHAT domain-containing protein/tetratricopeptide (TPR) repeat protein